MSCKKVTVFILRTLVRKNSSSDLEYQLLDKQLSKVNRPTYGWWIKAQLSRVCPLAQEMVIIYIIIVLIKSWNYYNNHCTAFQYFKYSSIPLLWMLSLFAHLQFRLAWGGLSTHFLIYHCDYTPGCNRTDRSTQKPQMSYPIPSNTLNAFKRHKL